MAQQERPDSIEPRIEIPPILPFGEGLPILYRVDSLADLLNPKSREIILANEQERRKQFPLWLKIGMFSIRTLHILDLYTYYRVPVFPHTARISIPDVQHFPARDEYPKSCYITIFDSFDPTVRLGVEILELGLPSGLRGKTSFDPEVAKNQSWRSPVILKCTYGSSPRADNYGLSEILKPPIPIPEAVGIGLPKHGSAFLQEN